jgi:hypothetical protein
MPNVAPPATTWVGSQEQEYSAGTPFNIADYSGNELVDHSGVFVVDNGVVETTLPATTWVEDETD